MSFAEQLAARAAETHSHNVQKKFPSGHTTIDNGTPPRPGKVISRGGVGATSSSSSSASSPSLFAEQLKQRSSSKKSPSIKSLPPRTPPSSLEGIGGDDNSSWTSQLSSSHKRRLSKKKQQGNNSSSPKQRSILIPACNNSPGNNSIENEYDDDEDEYSSVGFSLMDASSVASTPNSATDNKDAGHRKSSNNIPDVSTRRRKRIQPVVADSQINEKESNKMIVGTPTQDVSPAPFQSDNLSPIPKKKSTKITYPSQEQNDLETQSKLLLQEEQRTTHDKSPLISQSTKKLHNSRSQQQNILEKPNSNDTIRENKFIQEKQPPEKSTTTTNEEDEGKESTTAIFGAWAQIENLQRRLHESEQRCAKLENERASDSVQQEELNQSVKEEKQHETEAINDHDTENSLLLEVISNQGGAYIAQEEMNNTSTSLSTTSSQPRDDDNAALESWRKRALEAEQRLLATKQDNVAAAAASSSTSSPAPQSLLSSPNISSSRLDSESDIIIRLKNAEIDVLRSQIHRLEQRIIQDEFHRQRRDDNDFMHYGSSAGSSSIGHHIPLVEVASSSASAITDLDEFRLLRSEIRTLQYQLRNNKNSSGKNASTTHSTTGESTLSSLDDDDHDDDAGDNKDEKASGKEEQEVNDDDDNGNDQSSYSSGSYWGLCCLRGGRSKRGYGRV